MKITNIRVFEVQCLPRSGQALYEIERGGLAPFEVTPYRQTFTEIETDAGITGLTYGGSAEVKRLGAGLIGQDPLRVEHIWERLYARPYNRFGPLHSLSVLDLALWDLIGKARGEPVYKLLGGPCQERVRAHAAMLGFSIEPSAAAARSVERVKGVCDAVQAI